MIVAAMLMCVTSLCLFWISARHIHGNNFQAIFDYQKPHLHLHTGPYKYIRHPFYTAYILCYLSLIVSLPSKLLTLIIFLIAGYYYWAAKKEESSFLESSFSDSYKNYIKNTGMFFPKFFN
ncbi:hypothetical protein K2P97_09235 [bacterium]|nr:hypothetical protein [bacterium]